MQDGDGLQGAQAEYVRVPLATSTLVQVPAGVSDEQARSLARTTPPPTGRWHSAALAGLCRSCEEPQML